MTNPQRLALILSTGEQDLKLWELQPRSSPRNADSGVIKGRPLQDALLRSRSYRILLPDELRAWDPSTLYRLSLGRDVAPPAILEPDLARELCRAKNRGSVLADSDGRLLLRPAKLEKLIAELDRQRVEGRVALTHVLVFATDRMTPEDFALRLDEPDEALRAGRLETHKARWRREPYAAGAILADWLARRYGIALGATEYEPGSSAPMPAACWVNIMKGLPSFEGEPGSLDHPLYRGLVRRIDDSLASLSRICSGHALISSTGGSCDTKTAVLAAAELRFPGRHYDYPETEEGGRFSLSELQTQQRRIIPSESLRARARAADLIRRGDALGAWAAISHLVPDEGSAASPGEPVPSWLLLVRDLQRLFRADADISEILTDCSALPRVVGVAKLLQIAFTVEIALQGREQDRRLPEAVAGMCALVEQAIAVVLVQAVPELLPPFRVSGDQRELLDGSGASVAKPARRDVLETIKNQLDTLKESMDGLVLGRSDERSTIDVFGARARCWRHWLYVQSTPRWGNLGLAIERFEQLLSVPGEYHDHSLRDLRNIHAHAALDEAQIRAAMGLAQRQSVSVTRGPLTGSSVKGPLWQIDDVATPGHPSGKCFLSSPAVVELFAALALALEQPLLADPSQLYLRLLNKVLDRLHEPIELPSEPAA